MKPSGGAIHAFPDEHAEDTISTMVSKSTLSIRKEVSIMIKIKITVNGRRFNDINAAFQEFQRTLEKEVSQKKQEITMREKARHTKPSGND
jgi:hypothetical protein